MDLLESLKKLKNIGPDSNYTRNSKDFILRTEPGLPLLLGARRLFFKGLESGAALALAGISVILILGGSYLTKISPFFGARSLDLASLKAEAQNIDIQINLTNLNYVQSLGKTISESGQSSVPVGKLPLGSTAVDPVKSPQNHIIATPKTKKPSGLSATSESSTAVPSAPEEETMLIDQALQTLAE